MRHVRTIVVLLLMLGVCAVCMLPQYPVWMTNEQHHKQFECRLSLRAVMDAYLAATDAGVKPTLAELSSKVRADRRYSYTYVFSDELTVAPLRDAPSADELKRQLALVKENVHPGLQENGTLTVACVGNTDDDEQVDLLSVSSVDRYWFSDIPVRALIIELQANDFPGEPAKPITFEPVQKK